MTKCPECEGKGGWHLLWCEQGRGPDLLKTSAPPISLEPRSKHEPLLAGINTPPTDADLQEEQKSYDAHQSAGEAGYYDPPAIPTDEQMKYAHDGVEPYCDTDKEWDVWLADHDRRVLEAAKLPKAPGIAQGDVVYLHNYTMSQAKFGGINGCVDQLNISREAWRELDEARALRVLISIQDPETDPNHQQEQER